MKYARAIALILAAAFTLTAAAASAQTYPNKPITLIVPYPPGGATDAISRIIQDSMSQSLGQQLIIENIGGAGGMIAAARAARATPDGYTILIHQVALAAGVTMYKNLSFDAEKDFVPIGLINNAASTWAARPDATAEKLRRAGELDEDAWTERQGRACRGRLVRSSGRRAGRAGARRDGHAGSLSGRRSCAQRSARRRGRPELAVRRAGRPLGQGRQAQGLRHHRPVPICRTARPADHG